MGNIKYPKQKVKLTQNRYDALMDDYKSLRKAFDKAAVDLMYTKEENTVLLRILKRTLSSGD